MAKSKNNVVTYGLSGKIGDLLIFRQKDGQTIVAKRPQQSGKVSDKQLEQRARFQQAIFYGKTAIESPETLALYKAATTKGLTPFNVAVADFLNAPDIVHVNLSGYAGNVGDKILVDATDDFAVTSVTVKIVNENGTVEEGQAEHGVGYRWTYTATQENTDTATSKIVVSATDMPGNVTESESPRICRRAWLRFSRLPQSWSNPSHTLVIPKTTTRRIARCYGRGCRGDQPERIKGAGVEKRGKR